jgi:hypothetical protein
MRCLTFGIIQERSTDPRGLPPVCCTLCSAQARLDLLVRTEELSAEKDELLVRKGEVRRMRSSVVGVWRTRGWTERERSGSGWAVSVLGVVNAIVLVLFPVITPYCRIS